MPSYVEKRGLKWYAVLDVPKDLQGTIGRRRFVKSLKTDSRTTALRRQAPLIATWKGEIEAARTGTRDPVELDILYWRDALKGVDNHAEEGEFSERDIILDVLQEQTEAMDKQADGSGMEFFERATGKRIGTTEHIDEWITSLHDKPKTKDEKRSDLENFAVSFQTLDKITKKQVKLWCVGLMHSEGKGLKTVNNHLSSMRSYWKYLQSVEVVSEDHEPFDNLKLANKATKNMKADDTIPFKPSVVVQLRSEAKNRNDLKLVDLITLGMWTGARLEELCSLKVDKVESDSFHIEDAKTPSGWREVPIHSKLKETMKRLIEDSEDGFVLSGLSNNKYEDRGNAIGKRFGHLKADMGFRPRVEVFHSIRGTVATLLENAGVPENVAADILGHDKPTMTYGLYSGGADLETKAAALEKINYPEG